MFESISDGLGSFWSGVSDLGASAADAIGHAASSVGDAAGAAFDGLASLGHDLGTTLGGAYHDWFGPGTGGGVGVPTGGTALRPADRPAAAPVEPWGGWTIGASPYAGAVQRALGASAGPMASRWGHTDTPAPVADGGSLFGSGKDALKMVQDFKSDTSYKVEDPSHGLGGWLAQDMFGESKASLVSRMAPQSFLKLDFSEKEYPLLGRGEMKLGLGQEWRSDDAALSLTGTLANSSLDKSLDHRVPGLRAELQYKDPTWLDAMTSLQGTLGFGTASKANGLSGDQISAALQIDRDSGPWEALLRFNGTGNLSGTGSPSGSLDLEGSLGYAWWRKPFEFTTGVLAGVHTDFKGDTQQTQLRLGPTIGINTSKDDQLNLGYDLVHGAWMFNVSKDF